jgi:hypothetical protein
MPRLPIKKFETICAMLATGATKREIAKHLGIHRTSLDDLMKSEGFQAVYSEIQADLLKGAKDVVVGGAIAASKLMVELVKDDRFEMRDRLQAAKHLSDQSAKFLDRLEEQQKHDDDSDLIEIPGRKANVE